MRILRSVLQCSMVVVALACKSGASDPGSGVIEIQVRPANNAIAAGKTVQLTATVKGPPGIPQGVNWESNDDAIATVSTTGLVTGVGEGSTIVRAHWREDPEEFGIAVVIVTSTPIAEDRVPTAPNR